MKGVTGTGTVCKANIHPARQGWKCGICQVYCPTRASYKIHLSSHKRVLCAFCPQKFFNSISRDQHIREKHQNQPGGLTQVACSLAPNCKEKFPSMKEMGVHLRHHHKKELPWRCSYKDSFNCFFAITGLLTHGASHALKSWDETPAPPGEGKQYICTICRETFDKLAQLMVHTRVHPENKYGCKECQWHFSLTAALNIHGQDCHDTRHHGCQWCTQYFKSVEELH